MCVALAQNRCRTRVSRCNPRKIHICCAAFALAEEPVLVLSEPNLFWVNQMLLSKKVKGRHLLSRREVYL